MKEFEHLFPGQLGHRFFVVGDDLFDQPLLAILELQDLLLNGVEGDQLVG
ncbi:MAG: hypothetical protein LLG04_18660 [Parachlamydia sp.]|nr:hypothetical protein [Parachlamydia sp.]